LLLGKRNILLAGLRHGGEPAMNRLPIILMDAGWLLCVTSFFFIWTDTFLGNGQLGTKSVRGWELAWDLLPSTHLGSDPIGALLSVFAVLFYWLSNILILVGPLALLSKSPGIRKIVQPLTLTMLLLNLVLLVISIIYARDMIEVGYYLWVTSFVLVTCSLYLARQTRLHTV
jgi:hypothetical protein